MNEIDKIEVIKRIEIDEVNYFTSLIAKAYEKNILTEKDVGNFQLWALELLKIRSERYNGFESSSIAVENAEMIMKSNLYTIGVYLKKFKPDDGINKLKNTDFLELYTEGLKNIYRKIKVAKTLHYKALKTRTINDNEIYSLTLKDGINGFFKIYDPEFEAYNMKITADYPLYNNLIGKLEGIEFIESYLQCICYENEFCSKFYSENIKYLLAAYEEDYKDLIINIFSIVLTGVIGCSFADENLGRLTVSINGLKKIDDILRKKSKEDIYKAVFNEYLKIKTVLDLSNTIDMYIRRNFEEIQFQVYSAVKSGTLDKIFVIQKFV